MTAPAGAPRRDGADKLLGIEVLRFLCAFAVLCWHYQHFSYVDYQATGFVTERQPFYGALSLFYRYGLYGVQVFWCMSGFIFFWKYAGAVAQRRVGPRRFFLLRCSRLYPLHLATLLLVAALQALYWAGHQYYFVYRDNSAGSFLLQLGMASHWLYPLTGFSFNGPIWSVSLEVLAYLVFFLWSRYAGSGAPATLAALAGSALLWRYTAWPVAECLLYFYLGALVALARARIAALPAGTARGCDVLLLALLAAVLLGGAQGWLYPERVLLAGTPLAIYALLRWLRPRGAAPARLLATLGNLTYSSYLLHFPLQVAIALACAALGRAIPLYSRGLFLGFVGGAFGLAYVSYRYFERPAQDALRRRYGAARL